MSADPFKIKTTLKVGTSEYTIFSLRKLMDEDTFARMPVSIKVLLEAVVRQIDGKTVVQEDVHRLLDWTNREKKEFPYKPARVLMQDFTGVPAIVDLAAMRTALADCGGDPKKINPLIPVDLVIDHSVQVDNYASVISLGINAEKEFQRNRERYLFLRWGAEAFDNFSVVPPATGICHQVNLEYLAQVVQTREVDGELYAFPDSLVGTDSHTPMVDGIGVLGWGVGGIEAEAALLGQPLYMLIPDVIGFKMTGRLKTGVTATDLVLTVTQMLRSYGVVGKIVEFFGPGLAQLSVADRATITNMSPEYGATAGYFPPDARTLAYLEETGRSHELIHLVEEYTKTQGLFREEESPEPAYKDILELKLDDVEPSLAGHKRPQDRIYLYDTKKSFDGLKKELKAGGKREVKVELDGTEVTLTDGSVVISAITSCTNTSNPKVMLGAGLLAKKAVERGLHVPPYVKTSLAPGSRVVTEYLDSAGLTPYLEALGYHLVGYGCTTCIGNSGPLRQEINDAIVENNLIAASVLSGNRNFEGRIHPHVKASYLASPLLVVAFGIAGRIDIDLGTEPVGYDRNGNPVMLDEIWPAHDEIDEAVGKFVNAGQFISEYADVYTGNTMWNEVSLSGEELYEWSEESTYIRRPTFFDELVSDHKKGGSGRSEEKTSGTIENARVLVMLGDSVTTDHISPAGVIPADGPAAAWLMEQGVAQEDFNSFGSRRGNHEVMIRGTFGNIRIRNRLLPDVEGGYTRHIPSGEQMDIYSASCRYEEEKVPLIVIAGKEYGSGSSRDWAAKGTVLLGVKAVIAESYERIHRSNLIGMGVLPLQFEDGDSAGSLGLTGEESFTIDAVTEPAQKLAVTAVSDTGEIKKLTVNARLDTAVELEYYRNSGILHTVLLNMLSDS